MKYTKLVTGLLFAILLVFFCSADASAQRLKWKRSKPETLYARNKKKQVSPIYIGIGTKAPTAQLHTIGTVRFEGLQINNNLNSVVAVDGSGNLFWRDISNFNANAWLLTGNSISPSNFFGTTNNQDIRIRTNNNQRAVITSTGLVGIGVAVPSAQLHTNGAVRFEGLTNNDGLSRLLVSDVDGNLSWRNAASLNSNDWTLSGNVATASSFLGTTNNEDLRVRVNNVQRVVVTNAGLVGIGVTNPGAQLHTNGSVRFEGITNDNTQQRLALFDNTGNLFYRDLSSLQSNFWSVTGNSGTNPANNFLGTTDNNRLVFRTNNTEKMTILPTGRTGIGITNPQAALHVTTNAGSITAFPYETAVFEKSGDAKLAVLSSDNTGVGGAAITLGQSVFNTNGLFAGYEMQYGFNSQRYLRFNYLPRGANGTVQGETANILIMTENSRVGVNLGPTGGGTTPVFPSANFHTNGTVRFQGLTNGTGNPLVADANGNIFVGTAGSSNVWNLAGNSGTNPSINFLGTTDNTRLVFRTNNFENMTILSNGNVGIGLSNPTSPLHVFSPLTDNQLFLSGAAPSTRYFQGTDWLASPYHARIGLATGNANYVATSSPGDFIIQAMDNSNLLFGAGVAGGNGLERMRINSIGYTGISTTAPTAKLHVNCAPVSGQTNPSNIRFENLPTGTGNALVMDANGYVYKSNTLTGKPTNMEISELKAEIQDLKNEIGILKSMVNSMKGGTLVIDEKKTGAKLYQNAPNPFTHSTIVRYYIPDGSQNPSLIVSNLQGNVLKSYKLNSGGTQSITINGGELSAGAYFYTLFINGREVDSKKMILTR